MTNQSRNFPRPVPKEGQGSIVSKTGGVRFAKRFEQKGIPFLKRGGGGGGAGGLDGIGEGERKSKGVGPVIDGRRSENA